MKNKILLILLVVFGYQNFSSAQNNWLKFDGQQTSSPGTALDDEDYIDVGNSRVTNTLGTAMSTGGNSFTVEFWMRANSADQVLTNHIYNSNTARIDVALFSIFTPGIGTGTDKFNIYVAGDGPNQVNGELQGPVALLILE
jgi:hypothetical protein